MKKALLLLMFCTSLALNSSAFFEDFYLITKPRAEKLMPDTLSITMDKDERVTVKVDVIPKDAQADINWKITPAIATLTQNGQSCIVTGKEFGKATLTAETDNDVSCEIRVNVVRVPPTIRLDSSAGTIKEGEQAIIHAYPSLEETVEWRVEDTSDSKVSFGGNVCKIKAKNSGLIKVFATLEDTTVCETICVLPDESNHFNLNTFSLFLSVGGIILILVVLIHGRRKNEEL